MPSELSLSRANISGASALEHALARVTAAARNEWTAEVRAMVAENRALTLERNALLAAVEAVRDELKAMQDEFAVWFGEQRACFMRGDPGERGPSGETGPAGPAGPPGARGDKGDAGDRGEAGLQGPAGPDGLGGRDGRDGLPGVPGAAGLDGKDGRDGVDGKDGADGLGFDDLELERLERGVVFRLARGEKKREWRLEWPFPIYRGPWDKARTYEEGDGVTYGGSTFIAKRRTSARPETARPEDPAGDWTLATKKGLPGANGKDGERGPPGPAGKDGRDLTQISASGRKW